MDEAFDDLVSRGATLTEFKELAVSTGFRSMVEDGFGWVLAGETTLDEVARVLDISAHHHRD